MRYPERHRVFTPDDISKDWLNQMIIIWRSSERSPDMEEKLNKVFKAIVGFKPHRDRAIKTRSDGDSTVTIYTGGIARIVDAESYAVGVLLESDEARKIKSSLGMSHLSMHDHWEEIVHEADADDKPSAVTSYLDNSNVF